LSGDQLKKWAARIVTHFIQRYGNPRYSGEENKAFSEHFRANTAKLLLEPMVNLLIQKSQGVFVTENVHRMCISYVCNSVEMSPTYKVLKPHMEFLLFGVIFPTLSLSEADIRYCTLPSASACAVVS
jgi:importin-7